MEENDKHILAGFFLGCIGFVLISILVIWEGHHEQQRLIYAHQQQELTNILKDE